MIDVIDFDSVEDLIKEIERKDKIREQNPHLYDIGENFSDLDRKNNRRPTIQNIRSTKVRIAKNNAIFRLLQN